MPAFSFDKFLQYVPRYKVTFLALVPPVVAGLARDPRVRSIDFSSVREAQCGGSPLGAELQRQAEEAMNPPGRPTRFQIHQGLGMSEVVLTATKFTPCDREEGLRKRGVGYLLPSMEMKLVDDSGRSLDYQQAGEILLRGPNVFPGYWRKDKETYDTFTEDGWYRTGDVGVMSRSGVLRVVDRKKELIKVKGAPVSYRRLTKFQRALLGFQVAPAELEALLLENVDVQDVAVVGVPGYASYLVYLIDQAKICLTGMEQSIREHTLFQASRTLILKKSQTLSLPALYITSTSLVVSTL